MITPPLRPAPAAEPICTEESKRLVELEAVIQRGLDTFIEVGEALAEIRDSRLYRIEHPTFEDYCRTKWKMNRTYAHRLMAAAEVSAMLPTGNKPRNERQARPLATLETSEQQRAAWQRAVESGNGNPTAQQVEAEAQKIKARTAKHMPEARAKLARKSGDADCDPPDTPLRWLTHWWVLASPEEWRMFDNFRAGYRGAP